MKIITDTNIWYELGQNEELYNAVKDKTVTPTFVNIHELSKTKNILDKDELVRSAIQMLFRFQKHAIFEPPFVHLAQLNQHFEYNVEDEMKELLKFTSLFAQGHTVPEENKNDFLNKIKSFDESSEGLADFFNEETEKIRVNITDKKKHKEIDSSEITQGFVNFCVERATKESCNLDGFDMNQAELLIKTMDFFFKTLETSKMRVQANDWYDFGILAYVGPNDKYWTKEKRWINLIKGAGCENYLYE